MSRGFCVLLMCAFHSAEGQTSTALIAGCVIGGVVLLGALGGGARAFLGSGYVLRLNTFKL